MISLGSCTMKLNASVEMIPVTWPETAHMHPFAPADQTQGYLEMIASLNKVDSSCIDWIIMCWIVVDRMIMLSIGSRGDHRFRGCLCPAQLRSTGRVCWFALHQGTFPQ